MTNFRFFQNWKSLHATILSLIKVTESSSKRVEHTVGKEAIAHYGQFLLFQEFLKGLVQRTSKNKGLFVIRLNILQIASIHNSFYYKGIRFYSRQVITMLEWNLPTLTLYCVISWNLFGKVKVYRGIQFQNKNGLYKVILISFIRYLLLFIPNKTPCQLLIPGDFLW